MFKVIKKSEVQEGGMGRCKGKPAAIIEVFRSVSTSRKKGS